MGEVITVSSEIQAIAAEYFEYYFQKRWKMWINRQIPRHILPKLNQEDISKLNLSITIHEVWIVNMKDRGLDRLPNKFLEPFKEMPTPVLFKLTHEREREGTLFTSLYEAWYLNQIMTQKQ